MDILEHNYPFYPNQWVSKSFIMILLKFLLLVTVGTPKKIPKNQFYIYIYLFFIDFFIDFSLYNFEFFLEFSFD